MAIARGPARVIACTLSFGLAVGSVPACSSDGDAGSCAPATLIVGVQGQPGLAGVVASYRATTVVDGARTTRALYSVTDPGPLFPREITIEASGADKRVEVRLDAFNTPAVAAEPAASDPAPVLTRIVDAPFACGETRLVRVRLEAQCLVSGFPGAFGPTCTAPQSCQAGRCTDGALAPHDLEPYTSTWAVDTADACKPPGGGAAEIIIGTGQTDFSAIPSEAQRPEKGPQGGHHLWMAARMKNIKQSGSTTLISGVQPETGLTVPVTSFVFTYDRDEGGYCKIFGLRYQLDSATTPIERFLGKPLDVTVEVRDTEGASAKATQRIDIGDSVLTPGTQ